MSELERLFGELDEAIRELAATPEDEELQSRVSLAARSAFTHFHSLSVIGNMVDETAAETLRGLLLAALKSLLPGKFRSSVEARIGEFESFCKDKTILDELDTNVV